MLTSKQVDELLLCCSFTVRLPGRQDVNRIHFNQLSFSTCIKALRISRSSMVVTLMFFSDPGTMCISRSPSSAIRVHEATEFVMPLLDASSCAAIRLRNLNVWGVCVRINLSRGMLVVVVKPSSLSNIASRHLMPVMA